MTAPAWVVTVHLLDGKKWHDSKIRLEANQPQTVALRAVAIAKKSFPKHRRITEFVIKAVKLSPIKPKAPWNGAPGETQS